MTIRISKKDFGHYKLTEDGKLVYDDKAAKASKNLIQRLQSDGKKRWKPAKRSSE